jgi:hypothetical protein
MEHSQDGSPAAPYNKSLLRAGGRWYLVCKSLVVMDKLPMISLGEPPGAELSRYTTEPSHSRKCNKISRALCQSR